MVCGEKDRTSKRVGKMKAIPVQMNLHEGAELQALS